MIYDVTATELQREKILAYLKSKKFNKVVDVGGAMNPWARKYVTHYIDLLNPHDYLPTHGPEMYDEDVKRAEFIKGDVEDIDFLRKIRDKYGMFDFIICTHVLEHLGNPKIFLDHLPHMGWEGFVGVPNKYTELSRNVHCGEDGRAEFGMEKIIRGFAPHRWIFTIRESPRVLFCFPKLTLIEQITGLEWAEECFERFGSHELSFRWKNRLPYHVIDDTHLDAPSPGPVIKMYREELRIGL